MLAQDLRFGLRLLVRQPGFALASILTLALGIGANTVIFAVAWQLLLKPLPFAAADRLVHVWEAYGAAGGVNPVAPAFFHDCREQSRSFDGLAAYSFLQWNGTITGGGEPEQLSIMNVTDSYFRLFGTPPLLGRVIDARDTAPGTQTVVMSEGLWRRRFGADPAIVGRTITIAGGTDTVVGVMPRSFEEGAGHADLWNGMTLSPAQEANGLAHYLAVVGRLKPGVGVDQATREVAAITARTVPRFPQLNVRLSAVVRSLDSERAGTLKAGIVSLAGAAGFVLLIACANLASLQLARGVARGREFGVRSALGASRAQLIRQLVAESLVLSLAGALGGVGVGSLLLRAIQQVAPDSIRRASAAGIDGAVAGDAFALAVACALLCALVPALRATSRATFSLSQRTDTGDRGATLARSGLVTGQVALAVVLLVGAALLITSLGRVLTVNPGFDPSGVLAFDINIVGPKFNSEARRLAFYDDVTRELTALPGVVSACAINEIPFDSRVTMTYVPEGQTRLIGTDPRTVAGDCFSLLKLRMVRGRLFTTHEATRAAIVTESYAAEAWPGQNPIGRRVHVGVPTGDLLEVVGVVADSLQRSLERQPFPQVYEAAVPGAPFPPAHILVRTLVPPDTVFAAVRAAVHRVDPDQPVAHLRTLDDIVATTTSPRRFNLVLLGGFAALALVLAAVGIYGLLAEIVAQRRTEIGIRLALGAPADSVVRLIMTRAWLAVGVGVAIGLAGAYFVSQLLRQQLFGVSPTDVRLYAAAAAGLAIVGLVAAWIPARGAARVNPVAVLRS